ncbi:unnamed protein product [Bursaphelenchus okinawaensis]|uniref:Structural maintenance of chromosomes protein n=1 Tax=Bursaphelenchus okinawaensis TaxID=465554 RepID=A0A811K4I0_9BILA|nr:unnamed protein product [Bursaphelenchus okinawaensis]CAG9092276.1 unnamed protein product [Bursaphelenchus okinawaensis]
MRILKIEIDGFKSYGQYQALEDLDPEFNAITGLNGSGKSNALDAICFLLGITNLTWIRAQNNEDLVFKKGQGGVTKATVTITFDNSDPKHKPIGFEEQNILVIKKQIVLNGKVTYHINNVISTQTKVQNLFNTCAMNVNNPHFLIMQGRVTKVLNMTPRQVLYMVEEAAGVRVYEAKRKNAMTTLEKKEEKIREINRIMEEELRPRINKLKAEKDLYDEFIRLGNDEEQHNHILHCIEYYTCQLAADRCQRKIDNKTEEDGRRNESIKEKKADIAGYEVEHEQMERQLNQMTEQKQELIQDEQDKNKDYLEAQKAKKTKEDEIHEVKKNIKNLENSIAADEAELVKKKDKFKRLQENTGKEVEIFQRAESDREKAKALLDALAKGMTVDENGKEVSLDSMLMKKNTELNKVETDMKLLQNTLSDLRPSIVSKTKEIQTCPRQTEQLAEKQRLEYQRIELEKRLAAANMDSTRYREGRDKINNLRRELEGLQDKRERFECEFGYMNFNPPRDVVKSDEVVGVLGKLFKVRDIRFTTAIEVALGGHLSSVVVRYKNTAKNLLKSGKMERRTTFVPLDDIQTRVVGDRQYNKAVQLVGQGNIFRAIDLVEYNPDLRKAVEFGLGGMLIALDLETAKRVCFDREIMTRVVTVDGDDFKPDGVLSGGGQGGRGKVLRAVCDFFDGSRRLRDIEAEMREIQAYVTEYDMKRRENESTMIKLEDVKERINIINITLSSDKHARLEAEIKYEEEKVEECEAKVEELKPELHRIRSEFKELQEKKRNEKKFKEDEKRKAELKLREAENILKRKDAAGDKRVQNLEFAESDVKTTEQQIESQKQEVGTYKESLTQLNEELQGCVEKFEVIEKVVDELRKTVMAKKKECREKEDSIRELLGKVEACKKAIRDLEQSGHNFKMDIEELDKKKKEAEGRAAILVRTHSWLEEEKVHFNKPGTDYDFRSRTVDSVIREIDHIKTRRKELEQRVNMNAMKNLSEQEEHVMTLETKHQNLLHERERLQEMITEIDSEKQRELVRAFETISVNFGGIFSTLLPGACATLKPVDRNDLEAGLQVKVGFNGVYKESLDELSGGQRSLVALSLILAMLKCNPAPIYILDEVDAALDLSHTANVGTMIKKHFKNSQFIIVSLKQGMFNNANLIYRTSFVNGTSNIKRTVNKNS